MKRSSILILVMSWSNLCPMWNWWVFLLMTIWVLMSMFQSYVSWQRNALRRIVKYTPNECCLNIYQAFISYWSHEANYCDIVWHFCSNRSTYKIEKVRKNALWVTLNDYTSSYSDMLEVVKRPMLFLFRIKNIAIETLKMWDLFYHFQPCLTVHMVGPN